MNKKRIANVKKALKQKNLDALLVSSNPNIIYLSGVSFFEPTEREGFLFINKKGNFLITSSLYSEAVSKHLKNFELLEITINKTLEENLRTAIVRTNAKRIGFEQDSLTVSEYTKFKKILSLKPTDGIIQGLRQIKDDDEISKISAACKATDEAFKYILSQIKVGVSEIQIAGKIKSFFEKKGLEKSFDPIVAFGAHSSMPHHISSNTKLIKNQIVLLDFGAKYQSYCSDFTRTIFFGKADVKFRTIYQAVLDAQEKAFEYFKNGKNPNLKKADKISRDLIISRGFPTIPHSLGHSIGIEVHDGFRLSPKSSKILKKGMVFSIEPGIYIPNYGGVRIEDLFVMKKHGIEQLTRSPKNLIEIS